MGMNKSEQEQAKKVIKANDYSYSSNESKYKNGSKQASFSESGQSVNVNGTIYNSVADLKKSTKL